MVDVRTGIIGLGWLGYRFAVEWKKQYLFVWGTKRNYADWEAMMGGGWEAISIPCIEWKAEKGVSEYVKRTLQSTRLIILNIPPRSFSPESYQDALEQILSNAHPDAYVLYMSSTSVYKATEGEVNEDSELDEGSTVWAGEQKVLDMWKERSCILRLGGLIGDDRHPVNYLAKKDRFENPNMPVNLIHYEDVIAISEEIFRQGFWGQTLNVCNPNIPTRLEFYSEEAKKLGLSLPQLAKQEKETGKKVNTDKLTKVLKYNRFVYPQEENKW